MRRVPFFLSGEFQGHCPSCQFPAPAWRSFGERILKVAVPPPAYVRSIARDVLAVSVGFGLGILSSQVGGFVADDVDLPADRQRTEQSHTVSAATWTDGPWPFTIEGGELTCIGPADDPGVFIVADNGDLFALNPAAILMADQVGAMVDLDPIWRTDSDVRSAKVNISPMILYALKLS